MDCVSLAFKKLDCSSYLKSKCGANEEGRKTRLLEGFENH